MGINFGVSEYSVDVDNFSAQKRQLRANLEKAIKAVSFRTF